ncbi:MAG: bifunctional DNA-formamidopyrimidine glycosylase/DNA-(apurinic or apyrimidinic site) lyase [Candidatus Krumholzibacteria bacterium]|nr:bifunctional DNA-formamidopyrimidine glycosylase/DNA-(apurinic or apyrimidinic site) lyase [Candidatus Krumholzibacteria bacterium]
MPELPEVETIVRALAGAVPGRRVVRARLTAPDLYRSRSHRVDWLRGGRVRAVERLGKAILFRIDGARGDDRLLAVHLGMTGRFAIVPAGAARERHLHARIVFEDGTELRYHDARRFGFFHIGPSARVIAALGIAPDPFQMDAGTLAVRLAGRRAPVKALLLDQRLISGIGNIYADEALHRARMHPLTPGARAGLRAGALLEAARDVLARAIRAGGTTLRDYRRVDGSGGRFQRRLAVYGRGGEACPRCGARIRRTVVAGRGTHFCPRCQRPPRRGSGR